MKLVWEGISALGQARYRTRLWVSTKNEVQAWYFDDDCYWTAGWAGIARAEHVAQVIADSGMTEEQLIAAPEIRWQFAEKARTEHDRHGFKEGAFYLLHTKRHPSGRIVTGNGDVLVAHRKGQSDSHMPVRHLQGTLITGPFASLTAAIDYRANQEALNA